MGVAAGPRWPAGGAFWPGRRVLITGNTGFKGAWLTLLLHRCAGIWPEGLADGIPTEPSLYRLLGLEQQVPQHWGDVRDPAAVDAALAAADPDVVLHLAAQPFVRRSYQDQVTTFATNVLGTANVLDAVRRGVARPRVVVVVTSDKCYENDGGGHRFREGDPLGGEDPYSASKAAAELVAAAYRRSYAPDGEPVRIVTARAGNVIGGGDWGEDRLIPDLVRAAQAGVAAELRNSAAVRPWQHVLSPSAGYLMLAQAAWEDAAAPAACNFGPAAGDARPVAEVAAAIGAVLGVAAAAAPGEHPPEAAHLALDSGLARQALGWDPVWGLDRALAATADWYGAWRAGEDIAAVTARQIDAFLADAG